MNKALDLFTPDTTSATPLPLAGNEIAAGFPSPADDYMELSLDLNKELIRHPATTFFARVRGVSMVDDGIDEGDLLVIDKSLTPNNGCLAVCFLDGEFTLKRFSIEGNVAWLLPANKAYKPIKVTDDNDFTVWGIVTYIIKKV